MAEGTISWGALPASALRKHVGGASTERGRSESFEPAPGVLVLRISGFMDQAILHEFIEVAERTLARGVDIHIFADWELATAYDGHARREATEWVIAHRERVRSFQIIAGSKILSMGISVAQMALAIVGYDLQSVSRPEFVRALEDAIRN